MNPSGKALKYAKDVTTGKISACKWVKLACERFLKDLKRQGKKDFPYIYDQKLADRYISLAEKMPHVKGVWAAKGETIKFEPWQCFIECNIFGWVHKDTKFRRFREVFELIPRKNAKSTRAAIRGIYLAFADNEAGSEVYSGATSQKQAFEVYSPAWQMVSSRPGFKREFSVSLSGTARTPGTMYCPGDMSKFEPVIGNPGDGASPHGAIVDEYHEHATDSMVHTMKTGMGARRQPLLSIVSTAGSSLNGPCHEMQKDVQKILEGTVIDETIFAIIYTIDEDDAWDSEEALIKANPNYGVSVYSEFLKVQLEQAKRSATKQNAFRTKHLNEWVGAKTAWMNMILWNKQRIIGRTMEDFKPYPCRIAADLSSKVDVTAIDITFEVPTADPKKPDYYTFKRFFVPEEKLKDNEKYMDFVLAGQLETTPGSMIDHEAIEEFILETKAAYNVIDVALDEWNAAYLQTRLEKANIEAVTFPFRVKYVSEPMKQIEALVLSGRYWHDGNPVMDWMVGNVAAFRDRRDNVFPNKENPNDPRCKIDGVAAAIMSMGRWMILPEEEPQYQVIVV